MRKIFEEWVVKQMGEHVRPLLNNYHDEDGYSDQTINAMWIGFNGGVELADIVESQPTS